MEAGSRLLAPVTGEPTVGGCTANAYVAVLGVEGEPDDVLAAYAAQVTNHVEDAPNPAADPLRVANGSLVTVFSAGNAGGDS